MNYSFDDIELEDLLEWLESGKEIPEKIQRYALLLEKIWCMYRRQFDFPNIVEFCHSQYCSNCFATCQ